MHIIYNAYNIFGLSVDVDDRTINKRYKELTNLLKIGEIPSYPCDIEGLEYTAVRTEENINTAYAKLTNLAKKLKEQFFWFELDEEVSVLVLPHILTHGLSETEMHYKKSQDQTETKNDILEKLLKIEIQGYTKKNTKHVGQYTGLMTDIKNLLENEKFWTQFTKIRSLFAGVEIRDDMIVSLRNSLPQIFAEHFFDLSEYISDSKLYTAFTTTFNIHAKDIDDNKNIQKLHKAIEANMAKLVTYTQSETVYTVRSIIGTLNDLKEAFLELKEIGLKGNIFYDNTMEKCVSLGRDVSLYLHNKHDKTGDALTISKKLLEFDMSDVQKHQIEDDKEKLQKMSSGANYTPNWTTPGDSGKSERNAGANRNPHGKPISSTPYMYTLNGIGTRLYGDTLYFCILYIPILPISRYSVESVGGGKYRFFGKLQLHKWQKVWLWGALIFFVISLVNGSNTSTSSYSTSNSSSYTTTSNSEESDGNVAVGQYSCTSYHSGQADKLNPTTYEKNRIDTEEVELTRLSNEIDNTSVDEYSEYSVNSYNQKIRNYKTKQQKYNDEIADYNRRIEIYNNYLSVNCTKRY